MRRRSISSTPPRTLRCDRAADARGNPCSVKLPPRQKLEHERASLPQQYEDGGMQVIFGRAPNLVYPPTNWHADEASGTVLKRELRRDYAFGYNGRPRQSLHMISDYECVYPLAAMVIVLNVIQNEQRFFEGHNNDVLCLTWNERRQICASGQADAKGAGTPLVCIWAPRHAEHTIARLVHPAGTRGVAAVGLSPDGQTAVSLTMDDAFTFFVWRNFAKWDGRSTAVPKPARIAGPSDMSPIHSCSSGRLPTTSIVVLPEDSCQGRIFSFYTVGSATQGRARGALGGHYALWAVSVESTEQVVVTQKRGIFGKLPAPRNPAGIWYSGQPGSAWLVGDNGCIYTIVGNAAASCRTISPNTALGCVAALEDGRWLAAGVDGFLYIGVSDPNPRLLHRLAIGEGLVGAEAELYRSTAVPRFSNISVRGDLVLLGTSNQALFLVDISKCEVLKVLQVSHPVAAWGMDFHPSLSILASASEARDVRFWNVADRRPAVGKVLAATQPVFSVAFRSTTGDLLALGCDKGSLEIHSFPALQPVFLETLYASPAAASAGVAERLGDLKFSPDGRMLAAASWDQMIYLLHIGDSHDGYEVPTGDDITLHRILSGNSSTPLSVLFSANGQYLTSCSKDGQILFWNTGTGSRSKATSAFRDTRWQSPWTLPMGWPVIGVWSDRSYDTSDVKSLCQASAPDDNYVASGDDKGQVKLFRFPNPYLDPQCQVAGGHAAFVTKVRFSCSNLLASLGGDDSSIILWTLERTLEDARPPARLVHPWSRLGADVDDDYAFLGGASPASQPNVRGGGYPPQAPTPASAAAQAPWARQLPPPAQPSLPPAPPRSSPSHGSPFVDAPASPYYHGLGSGREDREGNNLHYDPHGREVPSNLAWAPPRAPRVRAGSLPPGRQQSTPVWQDEGTPRVRIGSGATSFEAPSRRVFHGARGVSANDSRGVASALSWN